MDAKMPKKDLCSRASKGGSCFRHAHKNIHLSVLEITRRDYGRSGRS
jgi:hypothetical protein